MHSQQVRESTHHASSRATVLVHLGLCVLLFLLTAGHAHAASQFLRGDANGDGAIDISDGITTLQYLFNCGDDCPLVCDDAADYDDNGVVEMADAILTFGFLFQGGEEPESPYPNAGVDSTEDGLSCGSEISPVQIAAGKHHSCAKTDQGEAFCWGDNSDGQLGDDSGADQLLPALVQIDTPVDAVAPGSSDSPVAVSGLTNAVQIGAGEKHTCALLEDGSVQCWGWNDNGQLGDGTTTDRSSPVEVDGLTDAVAIAVGLRHSCAMTGDGSVWCWGRAAYFAIGHGSRYNDALTPGLVEDLPEVSALAAGGHHTCALTAEGVVWCWGSNGQGQCGSGGNNTIEFSPVEVDLPPIESLALGQAHSCALSEQGEAHCWGWNNYAQLGNDSTTSTNEPAPVDGLEDIVGLAAGNYHSCALTAEQGLWCWGLNTDGQLGDGTTEARLTPVRVLFVGDDEG